jgi:hypothetical protein
MTGARGQGGPQTPVLLLLFNTLLLGPIACNRPFLLIAADYILQ